MKNLPKYKEYKGPYGRPKSGVNYRSEKEIYLNFGITADELRKMSGGERHWWVYRMKWLRDIKGSPTPEKNFYVVCSNVFGLTYDEIFTMPHEKFKEIASELKKNVRELGCEDEDWAFDLRSPYIPRQWQIE